MIALVRVDNRLIHGQVVEVWLPALQVNHVWVADDAAAGNSLMKAAMGLAVPPPLTVNVAPIDQIDLDKLNAPNDRTLLLVRDVKDAVRVLKLGVTFNRLNLGNVHFAPGRVQVTPSVFLSIAEVKNLRTMAKQGVKIEICTIPKDKPIGLDEIESRVEHR